MTLSRVKALCGLGALWELGTWAEGPARACPSAHQEQSSQGDTQGSIESLPGVVGGTPGWTGQGCGELETRISGAETSGTRRLEWHHGLWVD